MLLQQVPLSGLSIGSLSEAAHYSAYAAVIFSWLFVS